MVSLVQVFPPLRIVLRLRLGLCTWCKLETFPQGILVVEQFSRKGRVMLARCEHPSREGGE